MTDRQQLILIRVLTELERMDGIPAVESIIQAGAGLNLQPRLMLAEFEEALRECESHQWSLGITGKLGNRKWVITDAGRAALLELRA
jgi:hypothetical protein